MDKTKIIVALCDYVNMPTTDSQCKIILKSIMTNMTHKNNNALFQPSSASTVLGCSLEGQGLFSSRAIMTNFFPKMS